MINDLYIKVYTDGVDSGTNPFTQWDSNGWIFPLSLNYPEWVEGYVYERDLENISPIVNETVFTEKARLDTNSESQGIGGITELKDFSFTILKEAVNIGNIRHLCGRQVEVVKEGSTRFIGSISSFERGELRIKIKVKGLLNSSDKHIEADDDKPILIGGSRYIKVPVTEDEIGNKWLKLDKERYAIEGLYLKSEEEDYIPILEGWKHRDSGRIVFDPKFGKPFVEAEISDGFITFEDPHYVGFEISEDDYEFRIAVKGSLTVGETYSIPIEESRNTQGKITEEIGSLYNFEGSEIGKTYRVFSTDLTAVDGNGEGFWNGDDFTFITDGGTGWFVESQEIYRLDPTAAEEDYGKDFTYKHMAYDFHSVTLFAGVFFSIYKTSAWGAYEPLLSQYVENTRSKSALVFQAGRVKGLINRVGNDATTLFMINSYSSHLEGIDFATMEGTPRVSYTEDQQIEFEDGEIVDLTNIGVGNDGVSPDYTVRVKYTGEKTGNHKVNITNLNTSEDYINFSVKSEKLVPKNGRNAREDIISVKENYMASTVDGEIINSSSHGDFFWSKSFHNRRRSSGDLSGVFSPEIPSLEGNLVKAILKVQGEHTTGITYNDTEEVDGHEILYMNFVGEETNYVRESGDETPPNIISLGLLSKNRNTPAWDSTVSGYERWKEDFSGEINFLNSTWFRESEYMPKNYKELSKTNLFLSHLYPKMFGNYGPAEQYKISRTTDITDFLLAVQAEIQIGSGQIWAKVADKLNIDFGDMTLDAERLVEAELVAVTADNYFIYESGTLHIYGESWTELAIDIDAIVYDTVTSTVFLRDDLSLFNLSGEEEGSVANGGKILKTISREAEELMYFGNGVYVHCTSEHTRFYTQSGGEISNPAVVCRNILTEYLGLSPDRIDSDNFIFAKEARMGWKSSVFLTKDTSVLDLLEVVSKNGCLNILERNDGKIDIIPVEVLTDYDDMPVLDNDWKILEREKRSYHGNKSIITDITAFYSDEDKEVEEFLTSTQDRLEEAQTYFSGDKKVNLNFQHLQDEYSAKIASDIKMRFHFRPLESLSVKGLTDFNLYVGKYVNVAGDDGVYLTRKIKEYLIKPVMELDLIRFDFDTFGETIQEEPEEIDTWDEEPEETDTIDETPNL